MDFIKEKEMKNFFGIYSITNTVNNNVYIGQTRQPFKKRYWHHAWKLKDNSHDNIHLQSACNLYGIESFIFSVVEVVDDVDNLNEAEKKHIALLKEEGRCYNIQDGGQELNSYVRTEDIKRRIGEKNRQHMLGKKLSEETKKKMSATRTGLHTNEINYILDDEKARAIKTSLVEGKTAKEISESMNIDYKLINNILSNNTWSRIYVDGWDNFRNNREKKSRLTIDECKIILELYETGQFTQQDLADKYDKTRHGISYALKRARKHI